ncbi:MAG TPA: hypothetical protein VJ957_06510 [Longimicrobiales bacterium]|nr:hypothetical protein [Longimicrobiales bacterium]
MDVDWPGILGVVFGGLIVLVPVAGITARFALKPIIQAVQEVGGMRAGGGAGRVETLERRVDALEAQLAKLDENVERLTQASDFDRQLGRGGPS